MPTLADLSRALERAEAAGDTVSAREIAKAYAQMHHAQSSGMAANETPPAQTPNRPLMPEDVPGMSYPESLKLDSPVENWSVIGANSRDEAGLRRYMPPSQVTAGALALNAIPFNLGDETVAAVGGLANLARGGSYSAGYDQKLATARDVQRRFDTKHPLANVASTVPANILATLATGNPSSVGGMAAQGGGLGFLTGFGAGEGGADRIVKGTAGGITGAGLSALIGGLSNYIKAKSTPADARAADYVRELAANAGTSLDDLTNSAANASGRPITGAEAIGPNGETHLMALARREGQTGGALQAQMAERMATRPERVMDDLASAAGIHPEAAKGNIDALVEAGQAKAGPLFKSAVDDATGPVWNPRLERLAQRPAIQKAMNLAIEDLKNADIDPGTVGLADELATIKYARSAQPAENGIFATIKKAGGIRTTDASGNVTPEGQEIVNILKDVKYPGLINNKGGLSPDYMREHLTERNWFPASEGYLSDLYDAMAQEASGRKVYHPDSAIYSELEARSGIDEELANAGVTAGDKLSEAAKKLFRERNAGAEPPAALQPSAKAWDLIRKNINGTIERDAFGKPIPDSVSRGNYNANKAARELTDALKEAIPGYGDALSVSSDYLSARSAFETGQKMILNRNTTEAQFAEAVKRMSPGEREALKGGIANKIFEMAQTDGVQTRQLLTPRARAKLEIALGKREAQSFLDGLTTEKAMAAFERRATPAAGSQTMPLTQAMKEQNQFGRSKLAGDIQDAILSGHGPKGVAMRVGGNFVTRQATALADQLRTSGLNGPARDLAGELLMLPPDQLAAVLRAANTGPVGIGAYASRGLNLSRLPITAAATPSLLSYLTGPNQVSN